jgi:ABC-type cobalamin/Fe3+-siderophores transport system ATPase subunit
MLTWPAEPTELRDENNMSLAVREVTVGHGASPIVHDASLTVSRGTIVCVIGPNGAGKSTLLKVLTGRLRPFPAGCYSAART